MQQQQSALSRRALFDIHEEWQDTKFEQLAFQVGCSPLNRALCVESICDLQDTASVLMLVLLPALFWQNLRVMCMVFLKHTVPCRVYAHASRAECEHLVLQQVSCWPLACVCHWLNYKPPTQI